MGIDDFAQTTATYDVVAVDYAAHFPATEPEDPLDLAMIDHLVARLGPFPTVLDAGCGTGRISRYLADRGCRVTGLDLSGGMLAMAHRDHPDLSFARGSIDALPFAAASFDAALYWYSLIHSRDELLLPIVAEAARVVRPGGPVLLAFQVGLGSRDVAGGYRALGHDVSLIRFNRTLEAVADVLASTGFDVLARLERAPVAGERDPQGFVVGARAAAPDPSRGAPG